MSEVRYRIFRSRRRTLTITVSEGEVVVRAPLGASDELVGRFVAEKEGWILKKIEEQTSGEFADVMEGKTLLDDGVRKPVKYGAARSEEKGGEFFLKNEKAVRPFFERTRCLFLPDEVFELSRRTGMMPADVSVRDFKARWGCCDADGRIRLNWRLVMLPPVLREYVLIHELCHLKEMNHSAAFWKLVGKHCGDYRQRRRLLKKYSFLTRMYR
ncbi:MAG TPA: M48 family metallopeptidase [Candidatus Borkfalkia avicola]|uniref:M48 family metallopeptidase n=1 Tax=Candidatus Borkfalkia avicola TaxID=2838503 RepID=A0A9D2IH50_9FIRM|nr:M48 family metallopeptidase [Candidatus Borkfalkia avicola]